ncbi:HD domain-containing protein [Actinomadura decatromicini]|uniref:HD domain-containing protein n=1 Tax=Actinomadura decatromicini TaxID=2604572 RepID=A0A5D3FR90_9ACTN|nr:HD domain-containing protein [Actinomadura decatromicini]TYK50743.1 HD domain-containing protein [Actinomadura decatromicini]
MRKNTAAWARDLARKHLETPLPRRWAHTQGVARQARTLAPTLGDRADLLEAAAWLHDIGYAPDLVETGFHPLDGARYLRDSHHADTQLCQLVAHHSCALIEARERGLADELSDEFAPASGYLSRALIYCDMTTTPDGEVVSVAERLAEIRERYGPNHLVTRFTRLAEPHLVDAVTQVQKKSRYLGLSV